MKGGAFLLRTLCVLSLPLADVTPGEVKLVFFHCLSFAMSFSPVAIASWNERMS